MDGKIKQIFSNMDYGKVAENVTLAENWFKVNPSIYERFTNLESEPESHEDVKNINTGEELATVYNYSPASIAKILESAAFCKEWRNMKPIQRAKILNNYAKEIASSTELISQIEICARGILSKDTKEKSVPLLVEYLQFYSNLAANVESDTQKGLVVSIVSNENFLGILAFILGPVLAAGHNLIVHTEARLSFVVFLLIELSLKAGAGKFKFNQIIDITCSSPLLYSLRIPKGTIRIVTSNASIGVFLESEHADFITIFGNLDDKDANCNSGKRLLMFSPLKIPALIFNSADINSACDSITKSIWNHQGMLPYSVRKIFVQEDILGAFLEIFKERLKKLILSVSNEKIADITYPSGRNILLLKQAIQKAKQDGIEVYQPGSLSGDYLPTVFIGGAPDTDADAPFAVVLSFRTANEAVSLANNDKQAFGAIVWAENISLVNEVSKKLKVSNVWINTEGILNPSLPFSVCKESGKGYFGGKEGLDEYLILQKEKGTSKNLDVSAPNEDSKILSVITASKKAQESWRGVKIKDRIQRFKSTVAEDNLEELIYETIFQVSSPVFSNVETSYDIKTSLEPIGILVVKVENELASNLVLAGVLLGNSVLIVTENTEQKKKCEQLVKVLTAGGVPKDLIAVLEYTENTIKLLQVHKEVKKMFINESFPNVVPVKNIPKNYPVLTKWPEILSNVVCKKTVWATIGQSFI